MSNSDSVPSAHGGGGVDDLSWVKKVLKEHEIGPEISFASRTIRYIPDAPSRAPITEVDQNLFTDEFHNITISSKKNLPSGRPLNLHVHQSPRPDQVDASTLIFGVSTTFERFNGEKTSPIKEWTRWLTDGYGNSNGAGLVLALFNTSQAELDHAYERLTSVGINATVLASDMSLDMAGRYVDLVGMIYNHPTSKQRKYFTLIDDDTFFPAMSALLNKLSEYKPTKPYYIGTFTERVDWLLGNRAPMAYGGGGIFLTGPVASKVLEVDCLAKNEAGQYLVGGDQGDRLLYNCLKSKTEITLTYLPLLHQEDQFGDPSGFYESGGQPLSLHHYKSWHHVEPDHIQTVAAACGDDCVLQRFQFKDNFIISNGYSVVHYPKGIDFDPLLVEGTMDYGAPEPAELEDVVFSYSFGMLRKNLNFTGRKKSWEMLDSRVEGHGRVKQIYLKRRSDGRWLAKDEEEPPERDSVVVLTWIP